MHAHNRLMGQSEVLAQYVGCAVDPVFPPSIAGHLQHSWLSPDACWQGEQLPAGMPALSWTEAAGGSGSGRHRPRRVAIAAPWLYLTSRRDAHDLIVPGSPEHEPRERGADFPGSGQPTGTVWFPQHAVQGVQTARNLAGLIREHGPGTVALMGAQARNPDISRVYAQAGLPVVLLPPSVRPAGAIGPNLLEALWLLLRAHKLVASNGPHVAHLYGASIGLAAHLAGPPLSGVPTEISRLARKLFDAEDQQSAYDQARTILGVEHLLSSSDLRTALDWSDRD